MRARPLKQQGRRVAQTRQSIGAPESGRAEALFLDIRSKTTEQSLFENAAFKLLAGVASIDDKHACTVVEEGLAACKSESALKGAPRVHKVKPGVGKAGKLKAGGVTRTKKDPQGTGACPTDGDGVGKAGFEVLFGINLQARIDRYS